MWRYYVRGVVGDGQRPAGKALETAQDEAGIPAGVWMGRGLPLLGLSGEVGERQLQLLYGQGRHPDADRIEAERLAAGESPEKAERAARLGRPLPRPGSAKAAVLAWDLTFRPPSTITLLWALGDDGTRLVIEDCHETAIERVLEWIEDEVAQVRWGSGGMHRGPVQRGLVAARFRHFDSRDRMPLLHDHVLVSARVLRPDGVWGCLDSRSLLENVVAAGSLYNLLVVEEVCTRLGLASEPRTVTAGRRPVMEIAGIPHELIDWTATRSRSTRARLAELEDAYRAEHGHPPGDEVRARLSAWAADDTRPPKQVPLPLPVLRERWRRSAIAHFGAALIDGLLELARRVAAAIRARVPAVVDVALAAVDVAAVVYVMRGQFRPRHLLAEARRHIGEALRGRRGEPDLDERIVAAAIREHCIDVTPPHPGPGARPPEYRTYTARWTPQGPVAGRTTGVPGGLVRRPSKFERARVASMMLQSRVRTERGVDTAVGTAPPKKAPVGDVHAHQMAAMPDHPVYLSLQQIRRIAELTGRSNTRQEQPEPRPDLPHHAHGPDRVERLPGRAPGRPGVTGQPTGCDREPGNFYQL